MDLMFKVDNQSLVLIDHRKVVNLSQEYLYCKFTFNTDDWSNVTRFALFTSISGKKYRVAVSDGKALVPNAVLQSDRFTVMVYGVSGDTVRVTTNQELVYLENSGYTAEVEDDLPDDDPTIVEQIYEAIDAKSDIGHTHTEEDITDLKEYSEVGHTHTKSDVTDFTHTHTESDITDLKQYALAEHNHDSRYYTETEIDALIEQVKHDLNNRIKITADKNIMQTGDETTITAYATVDGMPVGNKTIYFYAMEDD